MKTYWVVLFFCLPFCLSAQQNLQYSTEKIKKGEAIYVSNNAFCPVSLGLEVHIDNATFTFAGDSFYVIPARTPHFKLGEVKMADWRIPWSYSTKYITCYGDLNKETYDSLYEYSLPYPKDSAYRISQGYGGAFSHQRENALDFTMPEGTPVLAAREGIVVEVVQANTIACLDDSCKWKNNRVTVYHPDGSLATYAHIRYNGAAVKPGDQVKKGDLLAYSGNTGYSSGPHLHFDCTLPSPSNGPKRTIPTKFNIGGGRPAEYLAQGNLYKRDY